MEDAVWSLHVDQFLVHRSGMLPVSEDERLDWKDKALQIPIKIGSAPSGLVLSMVGSHLPSPGDSVCRMSVSLLARTG